MATKERKMKRVICAAAVMALGIPVAAQDKAAEVMEKTRAALGGARLEQIKALALEGPFARERRRGRCASVNRRFRSSWPNSKPVSVRRWSIGCPGASD
jgi:hypothetical protein